MYADATNSKQLPHYIILNFHAVSNSSCSLVEANSMLDSRNQSLDAAAYAQFANKTLG